MSKKKRNARNTGNTRNTRNTGRAGRAGRASNVRNAWLARNMGAATPVPCIQVAPEMTPSGDDILNAIVAHNNITTYLNSHSQILGGTPVQVHTMEGYMRTMLQLIAEKGATLQVPALMCSDLERNVLSLEASVMEWRLETRALPSPSGYCWFAVPIRIPSSDGQGFVELTAVAWAYAKRMGQDNDGALAAPDGYLSIIGFIKSPAEIYGEPTVMADWVIGDSYTDAIARLSAVFASDGFDDDCRGAVLLRIFAGLFQTAQSRSWIGARLYTTDAAWVDAVWGDLKSGLASSEIPRAESLRAQLHVQGLIERFQEIICFVPATAMGDIGAIAS